MFDDDDALTAAMEGWLGSKMLTSNDRVSLTDKKDETSEDYVKQLKRSRINQSGWFNADLFICSMLSKLKKFGNIGSMCCVCNTFQ